MGFLKKLIGSFLGESMLGSLDYYRSSQEDRDWSGPFNGQEFRKKIFDAIYRKVNFLFVVETGTFRGVTTEYIASRFNGPVYSIESNSRNYGFARARLMGVKNIKLFLGDSQELIQDFFDKSLLPTNIGFFYLDAHWEKHLPLKRELELIFENYSHPVVMIDDFKVPDDVGYLFDDYKESGSLTLDYVNETIERLGLVGFFPNCPSSHETGKKRGALILTNTELAPQLRQLEELKENL